MNSLFSIVLALSVVAQGAAPRTEPRETPPAPRALRFDRKLDLPVTGGLVIGWLVTEYGVKSALAPTRCLWCAANAFDTGVRRVFNPQLEASESGRPGADVASTVLGFAVVPLAVLGLDAWWAHEGGALATAFPIDLMLVVEAAFSALAVTQATKFLVGRARPYSVDASPELLASAHGGSDRNLSFFSGHTSLAFSAVSAAATVATLRGYRYAWVTWAVGLPLATATGVLRLAADKHWASDVLIGAAVGTAIGVAVPLLFHAPVGGEPQTVRVIPTLNGAALAGTF